jgi:hypothetical protein
MPAALALQAILSTKQPANNDMRLTPLKQTRPYGKAPFVTVHNSTSKIAISIVHGIGVCHPTLSTNEQDPSTNVLQARHTQQALLQPAHTSAVRRESWPQHHTSTTSITSTWLNLAARLPGDSAMRSNTRAV